MNELEKLTEMKKFIDDSKTEAARIDGKISQLENQRATELGCRTDEEAEEYIQELNQDISQLSQELHDGIKTMEEELNWKA